MDSAARTDILRQVRERDIRMVRFVYCDISSVIRAKATHVRGLEDRLQNGLGLTMATPARTMLDQIASVDGLTRVGEIRLIPDPKSFVTLPYAARFAAMCADMVTLDAQPWAYCPRGFLKRMLGRLSEKGLRLVAAFEGEFTLLAPEGEGFTPADRCGSHSTIAMNQATPIINEIIDALESQQLHVEHYCPEAGHGQHNITIRQADGITAADNHIVFRETVRGVSSRHGLLASFAPKPLIDHLGNSCHVHFSLTDGEGRSSRFNDAAGPYALSAVARQFIAGVLEHLPGLTGLVCPSVNSYRRLLGDESRASYNSWGPNNGAAALRVTSPFAGEKAASVHAELQISDHSANPYLALGGLIAAGLDGIAGERLLPEPLLVDPATVSQPAVKDHSIRPLPETLLQSLDALAADDVLVEALGAELSSTIQGVKHLEANLFAGHDATLEFNTYNTRL